MAGTADQWTVVSHVPVGTASGPLPASDDPWAVVGQPPAPIQGNDFDPAKAAAKPIGYGYQRAGTALLHGAGSFLKTLAGGVSALSPPSDPAGLFNVANAAVTGAVDSFQKAKAEGEAAKAAPTTGTAIAHRVGQAGYTATGLLAPVGGKAIENAGEQFGTGDVSGGIGTTTALLAPFAASHLPALGKTPPPASEVLPVHVEALTSLVDSKAGTVDPHATATAALPTLRETAVRMGVDPTKLSGRAAGQATLQVAEKAVSDVQNEFNQIRQPYNSVLVEQKPIADAYRNAITPELKANEPQVAAALEKEAKKFDQPAPLEQVNQFRTRMNNQLNALEQRGTTAQIMSDIQEKASQKAANAARDVEYSTVGRLSGLDPEYVRGLKQREGSLIEAKSSLEKEYNRTSGQQGEAESEGLREKLTNTFPSKHGATKSVIKNLVGPKPIEVLNNRIQKMFADMGAAQPLPEYQLEAPTGPSGAPSAPSGAPAGSPVTPSTPPTPPEAPRGAKAPQPRQWMRHTDADVNLYFNHRFDMLRDEMQTATTPEAKADIQRRMNELDQVQKSPDSFKKTVGMVGDVQAPVAPAKPIYAMSPEELEAARVADKTKDSQTLVRLFGEDGAKRYNQLQRRANSTTRSFKETDEASDELGKMEDKLNSEQQQELYGEGKFRVSHTHEDYADFGQALGDIEGDTAQELGHSMRYAVTKLGDADLAHPESMRPEQQMAYAQLRHGFQQAAKQGFDPNTVWKSALEGASNRFADHNDAAFMLQRFAKGSPQLQAPVAPAPVANGQITQAHVNAENAFYTQARAELGANASPSAVLQRAQALKTQAASTGAAPPSTPVPPTVRPTLTQRVQSQPLTQLKRVQAPQEPQTPSGATPREQVTNLMLLVKQGSITPAEADSRIQRLVGSGGRRLIRRPVAPE